MKTPHAATRIQSQFRGFKAREYQTARRKLPIKSRSVYQSYLGSHMIENTLGQEGWAALEQLDLFLPILRELFAKHQGLKIHLSATSKFYMSISHSQGESVPALIGGGSLLPLLRAATTRFDTRARVCGRSQSLSTRECTGTDRRRVPPAVVDSDSGSD